MSVLERVNSSADVKVLSQAELHGLAEELRSEIIRVCSLGGGHLASSLGAVELTVALHALYDSKKDRIIWDVGHQTYGHKMITGRKDRIETIRKPDGLAGFTATSESEDDALTVGHASTSIAAALGMTLARDAQVARGGDDYDVVAVIGDGALTGGMALAALNQVGDAKPRMTIVLNDNEMSISENVGALNKYMRSLQVQSWFQYAEAHGKELLRGRLRPLADFGSRAKKAIRRFLDPASANPFHAMGVRYVGPIDGHNLDQVRYYLDNIKKLEGPTLLHIVTTKGKGYKIAESDPIYWHGPPKFNADEPIKTGKGYTWSNAFGDALCQLAEKDDKVWAITPAMREGSGLVGYSEAFPERYLDVGIAEDVCVTVAAGLALRGEKPIVAIYSTFLQRAYDQVIHDICLENLDVVFAIDRAGLVGGDGATHQGVFDVAYLRTIPNISIAMPKDTEEQRAMMKKALELGGPKAIRWPRGKVEAAPAADVDVWSDIEWGTWEILKEGEILKEEEALKEGETLKEGEALKEGEGVYILAYGLTLAYALESAQHTHATVINARFLKPLDETMLRDIASKAKAIITVEDHQKIGGLGTAVAEFLSDHNLHVPLERLAIPDVYTIHGNPATQHEAYGYGVAGIREVLARFGATNETKQEAVTNA